MSRDPRQPFTVRDSKAHTALLVDDDRELLGVLQRRFEQHGWNVITARSAAEVLVILAEPDARPIAYALLDLQLGEPSDTAGFALIRKLRVRFPKVQIVVLTGVFRETPYAVSAVKRGAVSYHVKPYPTDQLLHEARYRVELAEETAEPEDAEGRYPGLSGQSGARRIAADTTRDPGRIAAIGSGVAWLSAASAALGWSIHALTRGSDVVDAAAGAGLLVFAPDTAELSQALTLIASIRKLEPHVPVLLILPALRDSTQLSAAVIADAYRWGATFVISAAAPPHVIVSIAERMMRSVRPTSRSTPPPESWTPGPPSANQPPLFCKALRLEGSHAYRTDGPDTAVRLTSTDRKTLRILMRNRGSVVTYAMFEAEEGGRIEPVTLRQRIKHLRERLGDDGMIIISLRDEGWYVE